MNGALERITRECVKFNMLKFLHLTFCLLSQI